MASNESSFTSPYPRPRSAAVFDGPDRAAARAYMKGIGLTDEDLSKPTIGIANTWTDAMPCNYGLRVWPSLSRKACAPPGELQWSSTLLLSLTGLRWAPRG